MDWIELIKWQGLFAIIPYYIIYRLWKYAKNHDIVIFSGPFIFIHKPSEGKALMDKARLLLENKNQGVNEEGEPEEKNDPGGDETC